MNTYVTGNTIRLLREAKGLTQAELARQMLRLTLEQARARGIGKVRICCDHYNVASAKTIRANGGVLEDEQFDPQDGILTQRYWISNH